MASRILSFLIVAAVALASPAWAGDKVRISMVGPNIVSVIVAIAQGTGAFERNGIDAEMKPVPSGQSVAGIEQVLRGNVEFFVGAAAEMAHANSEAVEAGGTPPLAIIQGADRGVTYFLMAKKYQGKSFDELKNQPLQIGVTNPSSIHLVLLRAFLGERGLTTNDLKWRFLNLQGPDMLPAMVSGQIDGFMHDTQTASTAVESGAAYIFITNHDHSMGERLSTVVGTAVTGNRAFMKAHPDVTTRFLKALREGGESFDKGPRDKMAAIIANWTRQDAQAVDQYYDRLDPHTSLTEASAETWWDIYGVAMKSRKEIREDMKISDFFDFSYEPKH